jgi:tetraacyldisaccharide 4'-kinase
VRADDDAAEVGDEPLLLAATGFPVAVGRRRAEAGRTLLAAHPSCDVVIADDGLQHYALARDVEIAVVDAARGLGNGALLPAGPLREPAARLDEVDAVVRLVEPEAHQAAPPRARETTMTQTVVGFRQLVDPRARVDPAAWENCSVHAVAGIGRPQRFFDLLARIGIRAVPHAFPDHHRFTAADLAIPGAQVILMTAKDAVKCRGFADARCYALDIRAVPDPVLVTFLLDRLDGRQASRDTRLPGDQGPARLRP